MNKQKWILFSVTLALMASAAVALAQLRTHQKLGAPGVKTVPIEGKENLEVVLPERVLDYDSKAIEEAQIVLDYLPKDTSYGQRYYTNNTESAFLLNVVLMGTDRTSIHKPELCLGGQGWIVDSASSKETTVHIDRPQPYDLPVMKLVANKEGWRAVYVYWFVADNELTARHNQRMWWMARDMIRSGVLQRWAYVTCFAVCQPGEEDATFEQMKKFIAAAVPQFQLTPKSAPATVSALR